MKKESEPLEYIRGFAEFLGCKIDLSLPAGRQVKRPLIPRPETEFWVEKAIASINKNSRVFSVRQKHDLKILDIFCGSGCIGLAIVRHVKNAKVTFADKYKYIDTPNFIRSDLFSNIKGKFDYIFANPPYVATKWKHKVQKSVLEYEPHSALFAGPDGLFYIKKFLKQAKRFLRPNGKIFMEFSPEQKEEIESLLKKFKYKKWVFRQDQFDRWRWVEVR
jgi:release factor glutamine methyltransferase